MAVNWKAGGGARDAGDGCFHTAMFGSGIGEKKQRINEMAAYYLARAVVLFFFTYSALQRACYQKCVQRAYSMNPVCIYFMHILKNIALCFPGLHFVQLTSNHLLMTTWLIESFLCFFCCQIR